MTTAMDGSELARWTRFAAKGGIGKCTAVQDCVAESPEDLMFLKDDEIIVLMQLSGQSGFYLGYCEGVVGRFRGDHVRFHGKLKRPVMTKRASASAVSVASSPPPSVTPSPRAPLSPLTTSSSVTTNTSSTPTRDRDSRALSDPFDLELDAPPKSKRSEQAESSADTQTNANTSTSTSNETTTNGGPRRLTRGADDLPGLEMFLPRSRSGSRSRPTSSRGGGPGSGNVSQSEEPEKNIYEKRDRRRTRILTPQLHLQSHVSASASPRSDSLDIPPSPLAPPSPASQHNNEPQTQTRTQGSKPASPERQFTEPEKPEEVRISVEQDKAVPNARASLSPEPMQLESPRDKDVSSLYDGASVRSSLYSTHSYRSSVFGGGNGLSAAASDAFARLSQTESDDGGVGMGIGLSMLQDMADDEDDEPSAGSAQAAPPTPRPDQYEEQKREGNDRIGESEEHRESYENEEEDDSEYDEESDDDDESYWDGADIYDSYRYSRYSVMTKNSRRKSRFSVMSRSSETGGGPRRKHPVPLDAELRLRSDSIVSPEPPSTSKDEPEPKDENSEKKKHVPPPLNFVKATPSSTALLSPLPAHSPVSASNRSPAEYSVAGSDAHSPLLHTSFASPRSASSYSTSFGIDETDQQSSSPTSGVNAFAASASGTSLNASGSGAASTLRQRLEDGKFPGPTAVPTPALSKDADVASLRSETESVDTTGPGRGIVVEDDESVNVTVVPAEEGEGVSSPHGNMDLSKEHEHTVRDSVQSAVSTYTSASVESTATDTSDASDVSGYMRKIEADLAAVSGSTQPFSAISALADAEGSSTPTPTVKEFNVGGTTQPLRVQDRSASRSTPSPLPSPVPTPTPDQSKQLQAQSSQPPLSPLPSPLPSPREQFPGPRQQEPQQQQDAKSSQEAQLLHPEQALFLPHPNAPRPNPAVVSGQRTSTYGMPPVHEPISQRAPASGPPAPWDIPGSSPDLQATLRAASAQRVGPAGIPHRSTIFGKTVIDLANADGPVAIMWSLSPFPPDPVSRTNSPAPGSPGSRVPRRAATAGASPLSQNVHVGSNPPSPSPRELNFPASVPGIPGPSASPILRSASAGIPSNVVVAPPPPIQAPPRPSSSSVSDNNPSASNPNSTTSNVNANNNGVLMRPNFSPRVGTARPRSRSFSGFAREVPARPVVTEKRASEEGSRPSRVASVQSLREAASAASPVNGVGAGSGAAPGTANNSTAVSGPNGHPSRQSANVNGSSPPKRSLHTPSPLSRPENNAVVTMETPRASSFQASSSSSKSSFPSSPLGRTFISSSQTQLPSQTEPTTRVSSDAETSSLTFPSVRPIIPAAARNAGVRQVASVDNFRTSSEKQDGKPLFAPSRSVLQPIRRNSGPSAGSPSPLSTSPAVANANSAPSTTNQQNVPTTSTSPIQRLRRLSSPSSKRHERTTSQQSQASSTTSEMRSVISPPPSAVTSSSATSPVQRSNSIKSKLSLSHLRIRHTARESSIDTQTPSPSTGPATPIFDFDNQPETVQVQDAEFEMIRPAMRRVSSEPMSDDSIMAGDERPSLQRESTVESPVSTSGRSLFSPHPSTIADSVTEQQHMQPRKSSEGDAAAHRARELKWMGTMSSVPSSQARKNRKVRKLVFEGVPSSVRYLVWCHLSDCKAKRIPGVYGQLGKRGRVAASEIIERDAARCFSDHPHLQDPKGPLVGLLQTYLTMVPDIQYQTSLALVAGHLLLQAPEEDAFWIFTSMMDMNLRSYFSLKSVQMEADALVFRKAVEITQPQVAKKLFADLSIPPMEICRIWLPSLFATTLPQDYVNRIWDVYFCEGTPFIFRIGLAILSCCRSAIESSSDRTTILSYLSRPEMLSLLPEDPEEFINLAMAIKIKDDEIKKQRVKVETDLRKRTQSAHRSSAPRLVSSISLPRAGPAPAGVTPL